MYLFVHDGILPLHVNKCQKVARLELHVLQEDRHNLETY